MMDRGAFRRDLFGRLQGYTHRLWRLADRIEDLGLLVAELLARFQRGKPFQISPDAACALVRYPWPLNVRELAQALSHAAALSDDSLEVAHLPPSIAFHAEESRRESAPIDGLSLPDQELRGELLKRLDSHGGNVAAIARDMGKAPMQIYRWMQRLGINADAYRGQVRR
jgi:DNA-binding NtrC family response regulator